MFYSIYTNDFNLLTRGAVIVINRSNFSTEVMNGRNFIMSSSNEFIKNFFVENSLKGFSFLLKQSIQNEHRYLLHLFIFANKCCFNLV